MLYAYDNIKLTENGMTCVESGIQQVKADKEKAIKEKKHKLEKRIALKGELPRSTICGL